MTDVGYAPKLPSGIDGIDETWGGLYTGGSYLVFGRRASDRGLLPLLFAAHAEADGSCLYLASSAAEIATRTGRAGLTLSAGVDVRQLPDLGNPGEIGDEQLASALSDVIRAVEEARPRRVVIDDFMPFVRFHAFDRFRAGIIDMLERVDAVDATLMLVMAEPANEESETVIAFMRDQMTGAVHVDRREEDSDTMRRLTLLPNIGHVGREAELEWNVRRWTGADRAGRRFRFADGPGPSPREGRWSETDSTGPSIPSIPLGGSRRSTPPRVNGSAPKRPERPHRIPRLPLSGREREVPVEPPDRRESASSEGRALPSYEPVVAARPAAAPSALASRHVRTSHTDRDAFRSRLQQQFLRHDVDQTPFMLIAMRMDRPDPSKARPFDFDFILDLVSESLRDQDDMFVDLDRERIVVMLAESDRGAAQPFFARLKQRLRDEAPQHADDLMQSVSAIVVPQGSPFRNAEEFLVYAVDEQ